MDVLRFLNLAKSAFRLRWTEIFSLVVLLFLGTLSGGCDSTPSLHHADASAPPDWMAWRQHRYESIAGTNGWTTLVSRFWLPEGKTFVGTDPTNQLVLRAGSAPASLGIFTRTGKAVHFEAAEGVTATVDGVAVRELEMKTDAADNPSTLRVGALSIVIIERGERLGVRIRDPDSPARKHFAGLHYFTYDPAWRITGRFEAFPLAQTVRVPDAIGGTQEFTSPGELVFSYAGKEYRLLAVDEPGSDEYFIIFTDTTAGHSTYDAGRFLYVAKPDATGQVTIDFNKAFTPPCGFTPFATCPRPPTENALTFAVTAGELKPVE